MDKSRTDQLNKLDVIFNTTAKKSRQRKKNQNTQKRQKNPTPDLRVQEETEQSPMVGSETALTTKMS